MNKNAVLHFRGLSNNSTNRTLQSVRSVFLPAMDSPIVKDPRNITIPFDSLKSAFAPNPFHCSNKHKQPLSPVQTIAHSPFHCSNKHTHTTPSSSHSTSLSILRRLLRHIQQRIVNALPPLIQHLRHRLHLLLVQHLPRTPSPTPLSAAAT